MIIKSSPNIIKAEIKYNLFKKVFILIFKKSEMNYFLINDILKFANLKYIQLFFIISFIKTARSILYSFNEEY